MADPRPMTEAQLQSAVVALCKLLGLKYHHQQISIGSKAGWPDLTICGSAMIFRELKRETGKPTGAQLNWIHTLCMAGADAGVWRPSDLQSGRIQRELEQIR
jgi:hypothetical protein